MITPVEDIEFLARSAHRVNALGALAAGPQSREDLREAIGASNATVGRLLNEFDKRTWISRDGHRYELTPLGEFIATGFFDLVERFETEHSIRDIWQWFPAGLGFTIDMFSGSTITLQDERNPYCPNSRYAELIETSESLREVGTVLHKPENVEMVFERAVDGMEVELVFPREVMTDMVGFAPELADEALKSGNLVLLVYDDLPDGFWIFDERVGMCCRDQETELSRAVIDTSTAEARAHAQSLYDAYRSEATPFNPTVFVAS
ncbi:transcriptional regulator [Haloferax sp. MBLA0076]|uniref:Transcriptional regulator n=1 Tax=Haloferax litoreum TaxID=2666140 RepID=A0A6A8GF19_9EURY|nr:MULTISPECIES: transcriptional regulator [Haloferax]KAB1192289.1 transcriptional regulator [Haloferax sp. CBA1148]MRX20747.1 transcriptional regulator [Haloferax litoreum]